MQLRDPFRARAARGRSARSIALAELAREIAALAAQRRQMRAEPPRPLGGGAGPHRVDAGQRLVEHQRERVQVGRRARDQPLRLLGRHVGRRPDDVAGPRQRVAADHAGDAEVGQLGQLRRASSGASGTSTLDGLTSRCTTPWAWAWSSASHSAIPICDDVAIRQPPVARSSRSSVVAADELGDQVGALVVDRGLVQGHDRRVRRRAAARASRSKRPLGDPLARQNLDRDVALQALVAGQPDGAEGRRCRGGGEAR